ncbi:MAG: pyridoxamine 5'-phosphate oxidase family protein [Clostridiales bacterium]|nr:pyridoxamine 5'-phosphate oxidase family protein [Clostridiales bacterium]
MFREMRRTDKAKTEDEAVKVLEECTNGILSVNGDDGYPYGVPVSYIYSDSTVYFHCATVGHKLEAIEKNPKVSFCAVGADDIDPEHFTTNYKSVICFGKARIVEKSEEKQKALEYMVKKYHNEYREGGLKYIKNAWSDCHVIAVDIEHMTGKGLAR